MTKGTRIPRRKVLSGSAKLVVATSAAGALSARAAERAPVPDDGKQRRGSAAEPRIKHVNPSTMAATKGYTPVVEVTGGRTIHISGQVALDRSGSLVGVGNLRAQTKQVFENLKAGLEAVGASFADVIKLNIYMLDVSQVQVVRDVRDTFVDTARPPASTLVEVRRLVREEFLIEIDAIANVAV